MCVYRDGMSTVSFPGTGLCLQWDWRVLEEHASKWEPSSARRLGPPLLSNLSQREVELKSIWFQFTSTQETFLNPKLYF